MGTYTALGLYLRGLVAIGRSTRTHNSPTPEKSDTLYKLHIMVQYYRNYRTPMYKT